MSDIYKNLEAGKIQRTSQSCRVAYTINNSQPVACTIIGDQPLFYLDHESDALESEVSLFEDIDFAILENELRELKREMNLFDKFSNNFIENDQSVVENFLTDKAIICEVSKPTTQSIELLANELQGSRLASAYLECAAQYQVKLAYSDQVENAIYDSKNSKIFVNPQLDKTDQILTVSRELRRHYQHRQGALIHPLIFNPDNAILVNRIQICDLIVSMIRIAWELQLSGNKEAWQRIESSSLSDLGRAFAREAYLDFRTINNGEATTAVFEAWFLSERCQTEDKTLIQQMLSDYQGYVFDLEETTQHITPAFIAALGQMPFGKNYLAEHALTIMHDPIFSDIRDRSNANFLWFIKFERSFRETEHGLQNEPNLTSGIRHDDFNRNIEDRVYGSPPKENDAKFGEKFEKQYDRQQAAEIITLFSEGAGDFNAETTVQCQAFDHKGADIIYPGHWRRD